MQSQRKNAVAPFSTPSEGALSEHRAFSPPVEPEWHRMISEAAYYIAEKRDFASGHALEDWLQAESEIKEVLSR